MLVVISVEEGDIGTSSSCVEGMLGVYGSITCHLEGHFCW